jgi:hypothetical protein
MKFGVNPLFKSVFVATNEIPQKKIARIANK